MKKGSTRARLNEKKRKGRNSCGLTERLRSSMLLGPKKRESVLQANVCEQKCLADIIRQRGGGKLSTTHN